MCPPEDFIDKIKNLKQTFGKIFVFVDYGNVVKWFKDDVVEKLIIDIKKLAEFLDLFDHEKFFYYGLDPKRISSVITIKKAWKCKFNVVSKNTKKLF